jgi:hypothetical protein
MSEGKVLVELTIAAPADTVWQALRDPAQVEQWFGWDATTLAEEVKYIFVDHAVASDADRIIRFEGTPDSFQVIDQGDHCLVRLIRAGAAGDDSDWDGVHEDMTEGWLAFLTQLHFAMERHPGEPRRTIYLSGKPAEGAAPSPPRAGLGAADLGAEGSAYRLDPGLGAPLSGQVWRRSRRQLALTVEAYGDGLVLMSDHSNGGGSVIVTTYGFDDAAFQALRERWTAWWNGPFPEAKAVTATEAAY